MKRDLTNYISEHIARLKAMENSIQICIDYEKIFLLLEEWMIRYNKFSIEELDVFFNNVEHIIYAEIEIRKEESKCRGIWLTK